MIDDATVAGTPRDARSERIGRLFAWQPTTHLVVQLALRAVTMTYFEVSYRLLTGSMAGRRFLRLAAPSPGLEVHGYLTPDDLEALLVALQPSAGERLLDLGCGLGDVAREVHRRSGAKVVGVDLSARAIAEAKARATRAGVGQAVRFERGSIADLRGLGSMKAYAIDSLPFGAGLADALNGVRAALSDPGRLFMTGLGFGRDQGGPLVRTNGSGLTHVVAAEDVTQALVTSSRRRRDVARSLLDDPRATPRGRAAMALVLVEESLVQWLAARDRVRRWRCVIEFAPTTPRGGPDRHEIGPIVTEVNAPAPLVYQMLAAIGQGAQRPGEDAQVEESEGDRLVCDFSTLVSLPFGRRRSIKTREAVHLCPPDRLEYEHLDGPVRGLLETIIVDPAGGGRSRLVYRASYRPRRTFDDLRFRLFARAAIEHAMDAHFADVRERAEARAMRSRLFPARGS